MTNAEAARELVKQFDAGPPKDPYRQVWQWLDLASSAVANIDGAGMVIRHQLPVARLHNQATAYVLAAESLLARLATQRSEFAASMGDGQ